MKIPKGRTQDFPSMGKLVQSIQQPGLVKATPSGNTTQVCKNGKEKKISPITYQRHNKSYCQVKLQVWVWKITMFF